MRVLPAVDKTYRKANQEACAGSKESRTQRLSQACSIHRR